MSQLDCAAIFGPWENWIPESGSDACSETSGATILPGGDNKEKAFNYFVSKGLDQIQAAAVVGNLIVESSLNTSADQPDGAGMGIAQWGNPGRWNELEAFAAAAGQDKFDLITQLDFMWHELEGSYATPLANTKKQKTIEDATAWFMGVAAAGLYPGNVVDPVAQSYIDKYGRFSGYENPGTPHLDLRITAAKSVQASFGDGVVTGTHSVTGGCTSETSTESFTVATYNLLDAEAHADDSRTVGGCDKGDKSDPLCINARTDRQTQIITGTGTASNPAFDVFGTQETSPKQYTALKAALSGYDVFPANNSGLANDVDGETAIWWNKDIFSLTNQGKVKQRSNTNKQVTAPWVELQTSGGQKLFVISVHYANTTFGGSVAEHKAAAQLTLEFVKAHQAADTPVFVVGDFNEHFEEGPVPKATVADAAYCALTADSAMQNIYDMGKGNPVDKPCPTKSNPGPGGDYINQGKDQLYVTPAADMGAAEWTQPDNSGIYARASDHMPVYATMTFTRTSGGASCGGATLGIRDAVVCLAKAELARWKSGEMKPGHDYFKYSEGDDQMWCADFASWIYKQAGYPIGPSSSNWRVESVLGVKEVGEAGKKFHYHAAGSYTPKPGDIVIHLSGQSHVNVVTSVNTSTSSLTMIGGNQSPVTEAGYPNGSSVSEYTVSAFSVVDGITGYVSPD
jgi:endonuclease/exonuclease/phosphatase family metal-dependent hydrolase